MCVVGREARHPDTLIERRSVRGVSLSSAPSHSWLCGLDATNAVRRGMGFAFGGPLVRSAAGDATARDNVIHAFSRKPAKLGGRSLWCCWNLSD